MSRVSRHNRYNGHSKRNIALASAVGAAGIAAGIVAGVSAQDSGASGLEKPNGTIEQVAHNLGYQSEIGKLSLTGSLIATLPPAPGQRASQHLDVWNFSSAELNPRTISRTAQYLASIADNQKTYRLPIIIGARMGGNGNVIYQTQTVAVRAAPSGATWHDMLVVPPDAPSVPGAPAGQTGTLRLQMPNSAHPEFEPEAISVVYDVASTPNLPFYDLQGGVMTELCQNFVTFTTDEKVSGDYQPSLAIAVQETGCNMVGNELAAVLTGMSYEEYAKANSTYTGMMGADSTTVNIPTVSREGYQEAQNYFAGDGLFLSNDDA